MFSARTTIGHNHQKRFGRNAKRRMVYKAPQEKLPKQKKMLVETVQCNPYKKFFKLVEYLCPLCGQRLRLEHPDGRRNTFCRFCKKEFILIIERKYK